MTDLLKEIRDATDFVRRELKPIVLHNGDVIRVDDSGLPVEIELGDKSVSAFKKLMTYQDKNIGEELDNLEIVTFEGIPVVRSKK